MPSLPAWLLAFVSSSLVAILGTPILRRFALASDFVDKPGNHKSHVHPIPYLGGVALMLSVLVGMLFQSRAAPRVGAIILAASALGAVGLIDDHRTVTPRLRILIEMAAGAVAIVAGLRVSVTGTAPVDILITLVWIVGITNALNLLDNMDGLAAGTATVVSLSVFALAILGDQSVLATVSAAVAGACLGFLVYNRRPASIFMGDAGSLFLGFVLAVLTVDVTPESTPPMSFAVPVMLMALPLLDTATVILGRLRHGCQVTLGGKDHLSHRLRARGLSPGMAVLVLLACEVAVGILAVLGGRRVVPLTWAALAACVVIGLLMAVTLRAKVYDVPVTGFARRLRLGSSA